jgi:hypothetical protein
MVAKQQNQRTSIRGNPGPAPVDSGDNNAVQEHTNGGTNGGALVVQNPQVPDWANDYESTGEGLSKKQQDNLIPRMTLLQPLSKQCNSADPKYVPGAQAGMVHAPVIAESPLIECRRGKIGQQEYNGPGLLLQACFLNNGVNEWIARDAGGGFIGAHPLVKDNVEQTMLHHGAKRVPDAKNPKRFKWLNGNHEFIETRNCAFFLFVEEPDGEGGYQQKSPPEELMAALSFKSTEHTFVKSWMTQMNRRRMPNGRDADIYCNIWRMTAKYMANTEGNWYGWQVDWVSLVPTRELLVRGRDLHHAFTRGEKEIAPEDDQGGESNETATSGVM